MRITVKPNGNLEMDLVSPKDYEQIRRLLKTDASPIEREALFIKEFLPDYTQVRPEDVGALTDAPLIQKEQEVWGYMAYQVHDLLEELVAGNHVIWQKG